jgi:HD-GYP domain-containing protein (c-di-GMP phosphodiesterase class II)
VTTEEGLGALGRDLPLQDKLLDIHRAVQARLPFISRIAVALYDPKTTTLKTYLHSSGAEDPLSRYHALLAEAPSLELILRQGRPRVINNMLTFENARHEHTHRIGRAGYAASYTMPMFGNGIFFGFVFFNAMQVDVFSDLVLRELDLYGHLISLLIASEQSALRTLSSAVQSVRQLARVRDPETGSHLDRMSRYARLVALGVADRFGLDDEYIERVFMFSPLHDLGKLAIPDSILQLDHEERRVMRSHAQRGAEMIDQLIASFGLSTIQRVDMLRNIAAHHHEAIDGSGYPQGLRGEQIPLEARITAVSDVFDALTSARPYKTAWAVDDAFAHLLELAGRRLDRACVEALIARREEVEQIRAAFREDPLG